MKKFSSLFDFFLYSNLFISFCAAAMSAETFLLIHAEINRPYIVFSFFSTLIYYDLPSLFFAEKTFAESESSRLKWIYKNQKTLLVLLLTGTAITFSSLFFFPLKFIFAFIPIGLIALAYFFPYTGLRKIMGLKAGVVALVWTGVTALYPLLINSGYDYLNFLTGRNSLVLLQNFFFIFPLCVIFNVRDIEADKKAGVRTFASVYGIKKTIIICIHSLCVFSILTFNYLHFSGKAFSLFASALVAAALILKATENKKDYYYSFCIDGMILLQFIFLYLVSRL